VEPKAWSVGAGVSGGVRGVKHDCTTCIFAWIVVTPILLVGSLWLCGVFIALLRP